MGHIVVTPRSVSRSGHTALERLEAAGFTVKFPAPGEQPKEEELIAAMDGCVGYLAGVEPITRRVLESARSLRVISRNGVGIDNIDVAAAHELGIAICAAAGTNARGVAELTFAHILAAARTMPKADARMKRGEWSRTKGIELENRTLGVIGLGNIGRTVVRIGLGFGMRVLGYDPYLPTDIEAGGEFLRVSIEELISQSDVISLHCPPEKDRFVIGSEEIASMRDGVILVNTARDGLVNPESLLPALTSGKIRAFGVDAYATEPPEDRRAISMPNVIATPHLGGFTCESVDRAIEAAVENLLEVLDRA